MANESTAGYVFDKIYKNDGVFDGRVLSGGIKPSSPTSDLSDLINGTIGRADLSIGFSTHREGEVGHIMKVYMRIQQNPDTEPSDVRSTLVEEVLIINLRNLTGLTPQEKEEIEPGNNPILRYNGLKSSHFYATAGMEDFEDALKRVSEAGKDL